MAKLLTGLKPTGEFTLGNYIGAIVPLVKMQDEYDEVYLFVADLHALTIYQDPKELRERIRKFIAMYIACGVNPTKVTIYLQSENPYIPAISWLLECTTQFGEASRMIQFKEKSKQNTNFSVGLFTYPVLMAADILYCDTDYVPVGIDQKQHVELARDVAERFNHKYGETFVLPQPYIAKAGTKIKDLKDPTKKMSKSEENPQGVITMFEFVGKNYGEFKAYVAEIVACKLEKIQTKYEALLKGNELDRILDEGIQKSIALAQAKYEEMKEKMGIVR